MNRDSKHSPAQPRVGMLQLVCWVLLAALVIEFWMPPQFARGLHISNNDTALPFSCVIIAVFLTETFALRSSNAASVTRKVVWVTIAFLAFAAVLELGRSFVGHHAAFLDFLVDASAVASAVLLLVGYRRYLAPAVEARDPSPYGFFTMRSVAVRTWSGGTRLNSFAPGVYIIGAQKAATTSLATLLRQHPALAVSNPKEPHFFTSNFDRGFDWYHKCFPRAAPCLIDASTSYTMAPIDENPAPMLYNPVVVGVPHRIFSIRPDAKFIYLLRDPTARSLSAYWHNVRIGREDRPPRQALAEDRSYTDPSYYFGQIEKYLKFFDFDRFLFIRFDDFARNPLAEARRVAKFLGVEDFAFRPEPPKNETFQYNALGTWVRDVIGTDWLEQVSMAIRDLTPEWSHGTLRRILHRPYPQAILEDYAWLSSRFQKDSEDFAGLTGVTITSGPAIPSERTRG